MRKQVDREAFITEVTADRGTYRSTTIVVVNRPFIAPFAGGVWKRSRFGLFVLHTDGTWNLCGDLASRGFKGNEA